MDYRNWISDYLQREAEVLAALDRDSINAAIVAIEGARMSGHRVYVFGNGGSASTAMHMASDFNKGASEYLDKKHDFVCLCSNFAMMTACANDCSYENAFMKQMEGRLRRGDVVIAISGSGNSRNIIVAATYAKAVGATVIGMTGYDGGRLRKMSDISLHVPADDMQIAEDVHLVFNHLMMHVLHDAEGGSDE